MRRLERVRVVLSLAAGSLVAVSAVPRAVRAQACGPGPHWVDQCPSGIDAFSSVATAALDFAPSGGGLFVLSLSGPTTVWRAAGVPHAIAPTEIVSLLLSGGGVTVRAGDGIADGRCAGPDVRLCSLGRIDEIPGDPLHAVSFFDVFFEITGAGPFGRLHTWFTHQTSNGEVPCHMESVIDRVPPAIGTTYVCLNSPVALYDDGDVLRAFLGNETHEIVTPEPGTLLLIVSGVGAAVARRRTRVA